MNKALDLTLTRIIKAPRAKVWTAWADPTQLVKWFIPEPSAMKVVKMELRAGGAFVTQFSESAGGEFGPHINGSFLLVEPEKRLVFTDALLEGFRPAPEPFMTASITFADHADGTEYKAHVMHKSADDRARHEQLGFMDGWGTVAAQLAKLVER